MSSKAKKTILILSIALIVVVLAAVGTSYALFRYRILDGNNLSVLIGNLRLDLSDEIAGGQVVVNNLVPMKEETALSQSGYTFTLSNTGTIDAVYTMYLDDIVPAGETKTRIDSSLIKVNITNDITNTSNTYRLSELTDRVLAKGKLDTSTNTSVTYTLRIWLDINADNSSQNKYFAAKVRVVGTQKNQEIAAENVQTTSGKSLQQELDGLANLLD